MRYIFILIGFLLFSSVNAHEIDHLDDLDTYATQRGYVLESGIWSSRQIPVCWINPDDGDPALRGVVKSAVARTWEAKSLVKFTGWGTCPEKNDKRRIRIYIDDVGPHVSGLGSSIARRSRGMTLNFTFNNWSRSCRSRKSFCVRVIAVHEFGHALGFAHEHNRPDTPNSCSSSPQGTNGNATVGSWDANSVMNYCSPSWLGNGVLSKKDIKTVQTYYGVNPDSVAVVIDDDPDTDTGTDTGGTTVADIGAINHVEVADVNGDGKADMVAFGLKGVSTRLSDGESDFSENEAITFMFGSNLGFNVDKHPRFMVDINDDKRADIVMFGNLGVYTALGQRDGSFKYNGEVLSDFGYNSEFSSAEHLRMMGDTNGDGYPDIVGVGGKGTYVALADGSGGFDRKQMAVDHLGSDYGWKMDGLQISLADIDGDGMDDILGFGLSKTYVFLAAGQGQFVGGGALGEYFSYKEGWRMDRNLRKIGDFNGDGLADILGFSDTGVDLGVANPLGEFESNTVMKGFAYNSGVRNDKHPRLIGDINGDGLDDFVGFGNDGVYAVLSDGVGGFVFQGRVLDQFGYTDGWDPATTQRYLADFNGDGALDIIGIKNDEPIVAIANKQGGFVLQ